MLARCAGSSLQVSKGRCENKSIEAGRAIKLIRNTAGAQRATCLRQGGWVDLIKRPLMVACLATSYVSPLGAELVPDRLLDGDEEP